MDVSTRDLARSMGQMQLTPGTELIVVDPAGNVIAHPDFDNSAAPGAKDGVLPALPSLDALPIPALRAQYPSWNAAHLSRYHADGQDWFGMKLPLSQVAGQALTLLVVVPATELLGNARNELSRQLLWLVGLLPVALLLGLALARRVVAPLRALAGQVQRLAPGCTTAARSPARTTSSTRPPSSKPCTTAFTRYARVSKCCGVMPTSPGSTRLAAKPGGATLMTGSASRAPKKPPWPRCHPAPCPRAKPCWPTVRNT